MKWEWWSVRRDLRQRLTAPLPSAPMQMSLDYQGGAPHISSTVYSGKPFSDCKAISYLNWNSFSSYLQERQPTEEVCMCHADMLADTRGHRGLTKEAMPAFSWVPWVVLSTGFSTYAQLPTPLPLPPAFFCISAKDTIIWPFNHNRYPWLLSLTHQVHSIYSSWISALLSIPIGRLQPCYMSQTQ